MEASDRLVSSDLIIIEDRFDVERLDAAKVDFPTGRSSRARR